MMSWRNTALPTILKCGTDWLSKKVTLPSGTLPRQLDRLHYVSNTAATIYLSDLLLLLEMRKSVQREGNITTSQVTY